jgi:hypothetical protein
MASITDAVITVVRATMDTEVTPVTMVTAVTANMAPVAKMALEANTDQVDTHTDQVDTRMDQAGVLKATLKPHHFVVGLEQTRKKSVLVSVSRLD